MTGEPSPEVTWYLNNEPIVENDRIKITKNDDGSNTLRITTARPNDKGNYTIKAKNRVGEAKSFAKLVVKVLAQEFTRHKLHKDEQQQQQENVQMEEKFVEPYFKEKFDSHRVVPEGITIKFECIVCGKPVPKVSFFFFFF